MTGFQIHLPLNLVHLRFLRWVPSTKTKGSNDNCVQYNINANNLSNLIIPLKPRRMMKPSEIDYESKRKYFVHLQPASVVCKIFKYQNPSTNLKRCDKANATDLIYSDMLAIIQGSL